MSAYLLRKVFADGLDYKAASLILFKCPNGVKFSNNFCPCSSSFRLFAQVATCWFSLF